MKRPRSEQALHERTGRKNITGERIKTLRLERDPAWTMELLAVNLERVTGVELSISTIDRIEKGRRSVYDYEVVAFAETLEVSVGALLEPST